MSVSLVPGSADWAVTITASKVGAIMGASTYDSPTSIWHQLAGLVERDVSPPSDPQFRGTMMEPYVLAYAWQRRHPDWTQHAGETTWTREDLSFPAAANTDSHGVKDDGTPVIVEAKTVGDWDDYYRDWGKEGTDEVPLGYWYQCHFQMLMSGIREVRVELGGPKLDTHTEYVIRHDPTVESGLKAKMTDFYNSVRAGIPPEVDDHKETAKSWKRAYPDVDGSEWEIAPELVAALDRARADEDDAGARKREATSRILQAMGTARFATVDGERMYRRQKSGKGVALYPVKRDAGELAA